MNLDEVPCGGTAYGMVCSRCLQRISSAACGHQLTMSDVSSIQRCLVFSEEQFGEFRSNMHVYVYVLG
jgi:hypothetical protein